MKRVKVVVRDVLKEFSEGLRMEIEKEFLESKMRKEVKVDPEENILSITERILMKKDAKKEEIDKKNVKEDPEENFLIAFEEQQKVPKAKAIRLKVRGIVHVNKTPTAFQCEICKKYYTSKYSLRDHIKRHYQGEVLSFPKQEVTRTEIKAYPRTSFSDHQCQICQKYFAKEINLKNHMKRHYEPSSFDCEKCKKSFGSKVVLKNHICIDDITCKVCNVKLCSLSSLRYHMKKIHKILMISDRFICDNCDETFTFKYQLKAHFERKICLQPKSYACDHCGRSFGVKFKLRRHVLTHTKYDIKCTICNVEVRVLSLDHHMKVAHKFQQKIQCKICLKTFSTPQNLRNHLMTHDKKFECKICHRKHATQYRLKCHMKLHDHRNLFPCNICGVKIKTKSDLKFHLMTHDKNRKKHLKCDRCHYKTDKKGNFNIHLRYHEKLDEKLKSNPNAVKCKKCYKFFKNEFRLREHLRNFHKNKKKFFCDLCQFVSPFKGNIKTHIIDKHLKN